MTTLTTHPPPADHKASLKEALYADAKPPSYDDNATALCLLANPRPTRPSFNCAVGCAHYQQKTCPQVNCIYGMGENGELGTYAHMAVRDCMTKCKQTRQCPYDATICENGLGW